MVGSSGEDFWIVNPFILLGAEDHMEFSLNEGLMMGRLSPAFDGCAYVTRCELVLAPKRSQDSTKGS